MDSLPKTSTIGLLLSGGLDSCILLGSLLRQGHSVLPIYVDSGLIWQRAELSYLRRFLSELSSEVVSPLVVLQVPLDDVYRGHWSLTGEDVPVTDDDRSVYLPGRNALLLIKAALWCREGGIEDLALGVLGTSPFADAKPEFFAQFGGALNTALGAQLRIHLPFQAASKSEVMRSGQGLPLQWTFSCVAPQQQLHCGRCNKCLERRQAFLQAGLADPTDYVFDPHSL